MSTIKQILDKEQRRLNKARTNKARPKDMKSVFKLCSPHLEAPAHLAPYVNGLEKAIQEGGVEMTFAAPPQHGKTEVAKHAFILADFLTPGRRHAYATFSGERARKVREQTKKVAFDAGLDPHTAGSTLYFGNGTTIQFVGRGGGLTGDPVDGILMVDDILKDRAEASSPTIRDTCWTWFTDVAETRCHPCASKIVMMTRWSLDDLTARLIKEFDWPYIRLAAECDSEDDPLGRKIGEALWEKMRPLAWLQSKKRSPVTWASMYQGRPRPLGDSLFQEATMYDELPDIRGHRVLHGCDLAYTAKTRADWSVLLSGRLYGQDLYLTNLLRAQVQADVFTARMAQHIRFNVGPVRWYGSTVERGMSPMIRQKIPSFQCQLATTDKYVRAIPTAEELWNHGRILVPSKAQWAPGFIQRVMDFTGEDGGDDDDIDALAAAGDLTLEMCARFGASDLNSQIRRSMGGHLRLIHG